MPGWFKRKQRRYTGVDISATSIKMLEISSIGEAYTVEGFGYALLPETAMEGYVIKDNEAVTATIHQLLSSADINCKQAVIAMPDTSTISRVIQVNEGLREDEIEEVVIMEADKYIPYPIDEIYLDFNILGSSSKNAAMQDVLIVASRADNVNNRVAVVSNAGLDVQVVDIESYAVERASRLVLPEAINPDSRKITAVIDIGAVYTQFYAFQGERVIFSREDEFGGKQLLEAVMQRYSLSPEKAMEAMTEHTLPEDYEKKVLLPFNESMLLQVKRSLQFFFSSSQYSSVDYVIVAGGVAKQPELCDLIQEHLNISTVLANPFRNMALGSNIDKEKLIREAPTLLVACGLALRDHKTV